MAYRFDRSGYVSILGEATDLPHADWAIGGWLLIEEAGGTAAPTMVDQWPEFRARLALSYYEGQHADYDARHRFGVYLHDSGNTERRFYSDGLYALNRSWQHVVLQRSADLIRLHVDGVADAAFSPACGFVYFYSPTMLGQEGAMQMAEWAKWDRALSAEEIRALARGFSPRLFPRDRRWYVPMVRNLQELDGEVAPDRANTAVARHPRIIQAHVLQLGWTGGAPAPPQPPEPPPEPPEEAAPCGRVAGQVWHPGAAAGQVWHGGAAAGQVAGLGAGAQ